MMTKRDYEKAADIARRAHLTLDVSMMRECFVQVTRSSDENASMNTCSAYGAE